MDAEQRVKAVSNFLLQSPPGEINDVLNDVRNIIAEDESLHEGVFPALKEYNLAQFIVVDVPNAGHATIVSDAAHVPSPPKEKEEEEQEGDEEPEALDRFLDPRSKTTFAFDHTTLEASDPQPYEVDEEAEPFRSALESSALTYLSAHYHDGVVVVLATPGNAKRFVIQIVANKYNPTNFWAGRWRSRYTVDLDLQSVSGEILVNVHYYEQGNVQLSTRHSASLMLPPAIASAAPPTASTKILALIENEEGRYQNSLNDTYSELGTKTFKGLRRALPLTKEKLDWDRVTNYKLGAELSASKGVFGNA